MTLAQSGALLLAAGLAAAFAAWRAGRPGLRSLALLGSLAGFFLIFAGTLRRLDDPVAATLLLAGAAAMFHLLGRFEPPRAPRG